MRKKLFTLLLAVAASVGTMFAESGTCGDNLTWNLTGGVLTISGTGAMNDYSGTSAPWYSYRSSITSAIVENGVTSIGKYAFQHCTGLTSVTIGNSVTYIRERAFYNCTGLTSVTIPNSVTSIGEYAFYQCDGLTSVTIGNSVTYIRERAFYNCTGLTSVTIPNSVTSIGSDAFYKCSGLTSVVWNAKNCSTSGGFGSQITSFTFGNEVEHIPANLCKGMSNLTSIEIPNSVTSIGSSAFSGCTGLTSVTIPNSVTSIVSSAFAGCTGLTSVTIGNSVTSIGWQAFLDCTGLTSVVWNAKNCSTSGGFGSQITSFTFGNEVEHIPANLCNGMSNLTSIEIPNSVTSIGSSAFYGCKGLTSVTIPNSVTSIGSDAFYKCSGLTSVVWNAKNCSTSGGFGSQITSFTFGNEVEHIPANLCKGMSNLTSIEIPNSVTSIGSSAFSGCTGLTSPVFNAHVFAFMPTSYSGAYTIPDGIESIAGYAFSGCTGLTSVTIPNSVTSIGEGAFYECSGLTSVTIPNSVTSIGEYAFYQCDGLTSVVWNAKNCSTSGGFGSQITSFTFGNEVEHIPANLCNGMSNLTSIEIPNSVTSIGEWAFGGCTGLTSVVWNAKNCADFASNNTPFYASYYDQVMQQYIRFDLRPQITSFTFGNEVEQIPAYLCNGMSNLTSIEIPNSVTSIGDAAFSGCRGLTSVTIGNSVTSIGSSAFSSCSSLTSIEIPNSVTSIGSSAFSGCTGLTSVTIPNSVTSIGRQAFFRCTALTSMEAPAGFFDVQEDDWTGYTKILNHVTVNGGELTENGLLFINRSYKTLQTLDVSGVTNTEFADEAFKGYYNLQQLVLPAGLQKVGYMMVAGCKNLQSINIPASVEEIEQSAFEDCRSIQTITFGGLSAGTPGRFNAPAASASQLKKIGNWAFYNAHELQHLDIPEGVTEIGDGAFYGCTYLEDMTLPASVQSIGDNTFALCSKLKKITVNSLMPPTIQAKTFYDVKRQIPVYVPDESVDEYEGDTYWQEFNIQGISNMPTGIDEISSSLQGGDRGRLILHNGQIFILRGEKVYCIDGRKVK